MEFSGTIERFMKIARRLDSIAKAAAKAAAPIYERFTDNGDGTVTDSRTGLMWLKDASFVGEMNWQDAIYTADGLYFAGHCGWRLPDRAELLSLVDISAHKPALPVGHLFINVRSDLYWSASSCVLSPDSAWGVYMFNGYVYSDHKSLGYYVWPVRFPADN